MPICHCVLNNALTSPQRKGLDVITLFHSPAAPASVKVLNLLKRASAAAGARASDVSAEENGLANSTLKTEFELNITEDLPTHDQLRSILDYVGASGAGQVVRGAKDEQDALKKWKADQNSFQRPLVWIMLNPHLYIQTLTSTDCRLE